MDHTALSISGQDRYKVIKGLVPDPDRPNVMKLWFYLLDTDRNEYIYTAATIAEVQQRLQVEMLANSVGETTRVDGINQQIRDIAASYSVTLPEGDSQDD